MARLVSDLNSKATEITGHAASARRFSLTLRPGGWLSASLFVMLLAVWEVGVQTRILTPILFASPSSVVQTVLTLLGNGILVSHTLATLSRVALGVVLGGGLGAILGYLMGWSGELRRAADSWIAAFHALPKIAIFPLLIFFLGIGEEPKVAVAALAAFFPMLINSMAGVSQIHPIHFEVAHNYGAHSLAVLSRVIIPGSLPFALSGLRLAANTALLVTIAAEMLTGSSGLGVMIWRAWQTLNTEELWTSLLVIAGLGIGLNWLLQLAYRVLVPWHAPHRG